jgi:hypothetical protein
MSNTTAKNTKCKIKNKTNIYLFDFVYILQIKKNVRN